MSASFTGPELVAAWDDIRRQPVATIEFDGRTLDAPVWLMNSSKGERSLEVRFQVLGQPCRVVLSQRGGAG